MTPVTEPGTFEAWVSPSSSAGVPVVFELLVP
jgi:hypothetical protein